MKEVELKSKDCMPIFIDEEGDVYTHGGECGDHEALLDAIDLELSIRGLELYVGDIGSPDYFVCIKKRKLKKLPDEPIFFEPIGGC